MLKKREYNPKFIEISDEDEFKEEEEKESFLKQSLDL